MKSKEELHKHLDWINQNIDGLTAKKLEVEKQLEELENAEFNFKKLMPVGSIWLGCFKIRGTNRNSALPEFSYIGTHKTQREIIYYAHQIVKAAQGYVSSKGLLPWTYEKLAETVEAAKADGVLQNLE